ncbi:hypothetical protein DFP73DRAFT_570129 [Morchella snyderi]|nr:hypothetical protein DFP73DRAFT_570129 [Morchella snyderi]
MNKDAAMCTTISKMMMSAYFLLKVYMGFFFFKKVSSSLFPPKEDKNRTSKRISAKGSFYYVFLPILLVFLVSRCATSRAQEKRPIVCSPCHTSI